ncbi:MAG TPA: DUF4013 domain-containing protein [Dehalococcoidia bacterium]|nr:DUF4013 domain-containing protein [Dehalococcoidia bacterium]
MRRLTFREACRAPFADPDWASKLALGGALNLLPLIGATWPAGYALALGRQRLRDPAERRLPPWTGWRDLFRDGLAVWTIALLWPAPGLLLLSIGFSFLIVAIIEWAGLATTGCSVTAPALAWMAAGAVLLIGGLIPVPAALLLYLRTGRFGDAFHLAAIGRVIRRDVAGYLSVWWRCFLSAFALVIASVVPPVLLLLLIIGPWVGFHLTLVWTLLWAEWAAENGLAAPE